MGHDSEFNQDQYSPIGHPRIVLDPRVLVGKPTVKGTRISVDLVLQRLAHNLDVDELLAAYPHLTEEDVKACVEYARFIVFKTSRPVVKKRLRELTLV